MIKRLASALMAVAFAVTVFAQDDNPNLIVESATQELTAALDGRIDELAENRAELYKIIDGILLPRFDRTAAARIVLAKHWRTANEEQQERFIEAFYQALVRRYADGVLEFDPEKVEVLPFRGDTSKRRTKVRTTVEINDGSKVAVDYDLVKRDTGWLVFNVVIEGVSYVVNYRAELDSEINASSLDAVIERLENEAGIGSSDG